MQILKTVLWTLFVLLVIVLLYFNLVFLQIVAQELQTVKANQAIIYQELHKQKNNLKLTEVL